MAHEWDEYIQSSVFANYDASDKDLADEVVANTATINRSFDEISSSAATFAQMAESLNDNVRQFKLYND